MPVNRRLHPRLFDFDYLILTALRRALRPVLAECGGTVVDFGCGAKPYRELCHRATNYVGVDLEVNDPGDLRLLPSGRIPLPDAAADAVVSFQVLEHVDDVAVYLSECNRVLRPGGRLVLTSHGVWAYHPMAGVCEDYWRWTGAGLRKTIEAHGFTNTRLQSACSGWRSTMQQLLLAGGAAAPTRGGVVGKVLRRGANLFVNSLAALSRDAGPVAAAGESPTRPGQTLPICYVVQSWKA
jgi:hypothetical protein